MSNPSEPMNSIPPHKPIDMAQVEADAARLRKRLKGETSSNGHVDPVPMDWPDSGESENDELDVKELTRKIEERLAKKSSLVGYVSGISMDRDLESVGAQLKAAMGKQDSSADQSKTSDQIDSEGFESLWEKYIAIIACLRDSSAETITSEKFKEKLNALSILGRGLLMALVVKRRLAEKVFPKKTIDDFSRIDVGKEYQFWYTEALAVIKRALPSRLNEFIGFYKYPRKRSKLTNLNFRIADAICGHGLFEKIPIGFGRFETLPFARVLELSDCYCMIKAQCDIFDAANELFTSSLCKIQQVAQAELLYSDLNAARKLNKNGCTRAAGVIAGVALEKYLNAVIESRGLNMSKKKSPGINDYARKLKGGGVIDAKTCQFLQKFGKLRDLCYNAKSEPAKEEVDLLLSSVNRIIETVP